MDPLDGVLDWLPRLLDKTNAAGELAFSNAELRDFLAAMVLAFGYRPEELTPEVERLIADLALRAGVDPLASREDAERTLRAYFVEHPVNRELLRDFQHGFRAALVDGTGAALQELFSRYLANTERPIFEPRGAPREGAVRGGPLGFFLAKKKLGR